MKPPGKQVDKKFLLTLVLHASFILSSALTNAQVLEYHTNIKAHSDRLVREISYTIQINNKKEDWLSDIFIHYQEGDELDILEAELQDKLGNTLRKLGKKEITTRHAISDGAFFTDAWVKEFKLKWNTYPYRVSYRYRRSMEKYIYVSYWFPVLYYGVKTHRASLTVSIPKDYPVTINRPKELNYDSTYSDNVRIFRWKAEGVGPYISESLSAPVFEMVPLVIVAPREFTYGVPGSLSSWSSFGEWQDRLNADTDDLPPIEVSKVNQLIRGSTSKRESIQRLYHYLQDNTRYVNVSLDVGGYKAFPASYVSTKKYGDCKALTIFMKSLLHAAQIPSFYTNIYADANPVRINPNLPGPQFNHIVLCVPMEGDTVWLENTVNHLPYNYLGTFTQGRSALLVNGVDSKLVRTPALTSGQVLNIDRFEFDLDAEGKGIARVTRELRGKSFEYLRWLQVNKKETEQMDSISSNLPLSGFEITNWSLRQETRDTPFLTVQLDLSLTNQMRKLGNILAIRPPALDIPALENPNSRISPIRVDYPINHEQISTYQLAFLESYDASLPNEVRNTSKFGSFSASYVRNGNRITAKRSFLLNSGEYPLADYKDFFSFIAAIKNVERETVILLTPRP